MLEFALSAGLLAAVFSTLFVSYLAQEDHHRLSGPSVLAVWLIVTGTLFTLMLGAGAIAWVVMYTANGLGIHDR
jgi:hypothetical protein